MQSQHQVESYPATVPVNLHSTDWTGVFIIFATSYLVSKQGRPTKAVRFMDLLGIYQSERIIYLFRMSRFIGRDLAATTRSEFKTWTRNRVH